MNDMVGSWALCLEVVWLSTSASFHPPCPVPRAVLEATEHRHQSW